ncbi:MAG: hypothetical protein JW734_06570 [Candidatus Omnitrophica bacterium]|nr:hypothetical protein [Candidatus Omnitrophota bacterium]
MIDARIDTTKLRRAFRLVPKQLKFEFRDAFDHIQRSFLKEFRLKRLQGPPGVRGGGPGGKGPGIFNRFKKARIRDSGSGLEGMGVKVYTTSGIAMALEYGATRRAKSGRLAVPFSRTLRPEMYAPSGRLRKKYRAPGQLPDLSEIKSQRTGAALLARFSKRKVKPMFVLKHEVKTPARLGFVKTAIGHRPRQIEILNEAVHRALEKI